MKAAIEVKQVNKTFLLHHQQSVTFQVLSDVSLSVARGECVVLKGVSGSGKSTLLKSLYGNYLCDKGEIWFHFDNHSVDLLGASDEEKIQMREHYINYVSQFLKVVPRVSTLDIVMEPLLQEGVATVEAQLRASKMLSRLNIPEHLWTLSPTTFSGGEQQRVNIARGFIKPSPFMLLDEPTASLDELNRKVVIELIQQAKENGSAIVGIFHDEEVRDQVSDRQIDFKHYAQKVKHS
jgi:alpha-D-ribose 1-methylphosphonate 5-triphosphate synthase subunit PhnL